ncbi:polysaccharide pyruvyl transferase family protein [bacterium]|nr:polysaccharide pyruvyl transferase family protein [candidate division CSSED10-310 bacterium]
MQTKEFKAVLLGAYGWENLGDDALMTAYVNVLKDHCGIEDIAVQAYHSSYVKRLCPGVSIFDRESTGKISCQLLVYGGGTQFYSFERTRKCLKNKISAFLQSSVKQKLKTVRNVFEKHTRKPSTVKSSIPIFNAMKTCAVGIGIGPFVAGSSEVDNTRRKLKEMDYISVRDPLSASWCTTWQIPFQEYTDICFDPVILNLKLPSETRHNPVKRTGFIIRDWRHTREGMKIPASIREAVKFLRKNDDLPAYFSFCANTDKRWISNLTTDRESLYIWRPMQMNLNDYLINLSTCDVIVTQRYHGLIFAAMQGIPVIAAGVDPKLIKGAEAVGLDDYIWYPPFSFKDLIRLIEQVRYHKDDISDRVRMKTADLAQTAQNMINHFVSYAETEVF